MASGSGGRNVPGSGESLGGQGPKVGWRLIHKKMKDNRKRLHLMLT